MGDHGTKAGVSGAGDSGDIAQGRSRLPPGAYLKDEMLDRLARQNVELLSELWILRDRLAVVERLLADRGVIEAGAVDGFQPDEAFSAYLDAMRAHMVQNVIGAPMKHEQDVAALKARAHALRDAGPA